MSIVVPNFNHAPYLRKRLDSILDQTYSNIEIILLDDNSADESVAVFEQYARHPKVAHFIRNATNSGSPFQQWRKGVELAQADYIWIAESDDWASPRFLETLTPYFRSAESVRAAFCRSRMVDRNDRVLGLWNDVFTRSAQGEESIQLDNGHIDEFFVQCNCLPNVSAAIVRKQAFKALDADVLAYKHSGD